MPGITVNENGPYKNHTLNTVRVQNVAHTVTKQDVVALFNSLVAPIENCEERIGKANSVSFDLSFYNYNDAKKALCMSGYNLGENALSVTPLDYKGKECKVTQYLRGSDDRRNLYVLNLPCDFTKSQFTELFSRYGTVSHCVILATTDNASRRRGFIVMSTHEEAKTVMRNLSRTDIKGYVIDISWSVVQRSQGFLDGGDRNFEFPHSSESSICFDQDRNGYRKSLCPSEEKTCFLPSIVPPLSTLLVTNLSALLFSQITDLFALFCPFGNIKRLEILDSSAAVTSAAVSAIVEYTTTPGAQEAKEALHGQCYADCKISVEYFLPSSSDSLGILGSPAHVVSDSVSLAVPTFHREVLQKSGCTATSPSPVLTNEFNYASGWELPASFFNDAPCGCVDRSECCPPCNKNNPIFLNSRSSSANSRLSSESHRQSVPCVFYHPAVPTMLRHCA